ncbi:MAG: hypothetical protein AAGF89_12110, partial [Bacteroidota bacterium]
PPPPPLRDATTDSNPDSPSAWINQLTAIYNQHAELYNELDPSDLRSNQDTASSISTPNYFDAINSITENLDTIVSTIVLDNQGYDYFPSTYLSNLEHIRGLLYYELSREDGVYAELSQETYFNLQEEGFFDTLSYRPNLQTFWEDNEEEEFTGGGFDFPLQTQESPAQQRPIGTAPPSTSNIETISFQLQVNNQADASPVVNARIQVFYHNELQGRSVQTNPYGAATVSIPVKEIGREILISKEGFDDLKISTKEISQAVAGSAPLIVSLSPQNSGTVDIPDVTLYFGAGEGISTRPTSLPELVDFLVEESKATLSNPRFNRRNESTSGYESRLQEGISRLDIVRAQLSDLCRQELPVLITISSYQAVNPSKPISAGATSFGGVVQYALTYDQALQACFNQGIFTVIMQPVEGVPWPVNESGAFLDVNDVQVRQIDRVVVSFSTPSAASGE